MSATRWVRELHIAAGLFCVPLALIYAASALQMGHPRVPGPSYTERRVAVSGNAPVTEDAMVATLRIRAAHLEPMPVPAGADTVAVRVEGLAMTEELRLSASTGSGARIERRGNLMAVLNRLHHTAGLPARGWAAAWGVLAMLASLGMVVLGIGGIVLWLPRTAERRIGLWSLAASAGIALSLVVWIRILG